MADKTIGDLTASGPLTGSELIEVEQSGNSRKTTPQAIADLVPAPVYGAGNAALAYGAVGTYVLGYMSIASILENTNHAGSSIEPAGFLSGASGMADDASMTPFGTKGGAGLSGTWRSMGRSNPSSGTVRDRITLFMRIS